MRSVLLAVVCGLAAGCGSAERQHFGDAGLGGGLYFSEPDESACEGRTQPDDPVIDGFTYCLRDQRMNEVERPIMASCDVAPDGFGLDVEVYWINDGNIARAYPVRMLGNGRELLHTEWNGVPVMVDW